MSESIDPMEAMKREFEEVMDGKVDEDEARLLKIMSLQEGLLNGGRTESYLVELAKLRDMGDV